MEQEKAGAEDGTQRPVDLRERSDLKKEKPPKGFERSDKRASVICSPGRRRRPESRLLEHAKRSGTRRAAEAGPQKRPEENHSAGACAGRMILRREQRSEPTGGEPSLRAA